MKKNDFILIGSVLLILILIIAIFYSQRTEGSKVSVYRDGKEVLSFDMNKDITYTIRGEQGEWNTLTIKDNVVDMVDASCPDKLCVHQKKIHYNKETIICLPNRIVLEIIGGEENQIDSIVN